MNLSLDGVTLPMNDLVSEVIRDHIRAGTYEKHERVILDKLLRKDDIVLELGTGLGFLAVWCSQRCLHVVTIEANAKLVPLIHLTFSVNGAWPTLLPLGVSRDGGLQALDESPDFWASSTRPGGDRPSVSFDALLKLSRPTLLLMDIEGAEVELAGTELPKGLRAAVIETHGPEATRTVVTWMIREGFEPIVSSANVVGFVRQNLTSPS